MYGSQDPQFSGTSPELSKVIMVFTKTSVIGFHHWKDAPLDVSYLREQHRHEFGISVEISVDHPDRAIEFHTLKRQLRQMLFSKFTRGGGLTPLPDDEFFFGPMSCEAIAAAIVNWLVNAYPHRNNYSVQVTEDDENGAYITARY